MTEDSTDEIEQLKQEASELGIDINSNQEEWTPPNPEVKDNIYKFFRDVLKEKDSTRIGNLKDDELGRAKKSVRALNNISEYANIEGLPLVSDYIKNKSLNITSTSMSRKGWFMSLTVTQIKREHKSNASTQQPKKFSFFGRTKTEGEEENA